MVPVIHILRLFISLETKMAPPSPPHHCHTTQVDTTSTNDVRRPVGETWQPIRLPADIVKPKRKREAMKGVTGSTKYHGPSLSEYELERLETIRQNQAFLSALNLPQLADLRRKRLPRKKEVGQALPPRKSLRVSKEEKNCPVPPTYIAPVPMCPVNLEDGSSLPEDFIRLWVELPVKRKRKWNEKKMDLESYKEGLQKMGIQEDCVAKVVPQHVSSVAFHPCHSSLLMAAGNCFGDVGIWNPEASWGNDGVLLFRPHTRAISFMKFSKSHPSTLITTSYDETVRKGDVERAEFEEVYRLKDLRSFDFLSDDCTTLLLGNKWGYATIYDMRTQKSSHESFDVMGGFGSSSKMKTMRCVHVHPVHKNYFLAAGFSGVRICDVRYLKKAVSDLGGPRANGACFSPDTGNRVLATGNDDTLRVFDTSQMISSPPLITSIPHTTQKGLLKGVNIQAVWDPKQEDCFAVGCFGLPPRIKVFHESGELLHTFQIPDHMATSACDLVAFHPTRSALLGGNSKGRGHVFT